MSNIQTHYHFNLVFQEVDQHTGGKWLAHGTKLLKDNQLQSLNPILKDNTQGRKHPGRCICRTKIT